MEYHDEHGVNVFDQWYAAQLDEARATFDYVLNEIAIMVNFSDQQLFLPMDRNEKGLWEVRFKVVFNGRLKRQFRAVGFWNYDWEDRREFILVTGCQKSGRSTIPPGAYGLALDLLEKFFLEGKDNLYEYPF